MSIHRFAAKRDDNEPAIRARFATHGWHTEQLSGAGMPDLLCWALHDARSVITHPSLIGSVLVDVKMPGKKATKAQVEKWTALSEKGIPVYVASTEADVDAIVGGTATPWASDVPPCHAKGQPCRRRRHKHPSPDFTPPRSTPVDAQALAAETFAPPQVLGDPCQCRPGSVCSLHEGDACAIPGCINATPCPRHSLSALGRR